MKYRIKEVIKNGRSRFYPQVRLWLTWHTIQEGQKGIGHYDCVEYTYEDAMRHITEYKEDYTKESVVTHEVGQ